MTLSLRHRACRAAWMLTAVLIATTASAQTSLQIPLQFDFLNPGAKSLALGGAFAGLADDATATFANPAGLTQLDDSEFSIDLRFTNIATPFLAGGRLSGPVSNRGIDTRQGALFGESENSHAGPGFISGVYSHSSNRWVIAGYRHELVRIDQSFLSTGVFQRDPTELTSRRDDPRTGERSVNITGYGASGSFLIRPGISVGAALTVYTFDLVSRFQRLDYVGFDGPPILDRPVGEATQDGEDVAVAPTVGVLLGRDRVRVGVVYRRGASFDTSTNDGTGIVREGLFRVPHTFAAGVSFRPINSLTLASEVTHVSYGRLREDFVTHQAIGSGRTDSFTIDSGTEFHLGVQYARPQWSGRPRFRVGTWFDPDHSVRFTPPTPTSPFPVDRLFDERISVALSNGEARWHLTGGVGLSFGAHLELNAGIDGTSEARVFSTSLIVR